MLGQAFHHREHGVAEPQFKFKIPNSRGCNKNDSRQQSSRAVKEFANASPEIKETTLSPALAGDLAFPLL